jgi:hypothetical protein
MLNLSWGEEHVMSTRPHMDSDGLIFFQDQLSRSSCYLEFGCGGSTVYACNDAKVKTVISVDTDPKWIEKIRSETSSSDVDLYMDHIDLGKVGNWGTPKTADRYRDFWKYSSSPWRKAAELHVVPDTVLIDGRFRIACFLFSLLTARAGTTIIFDDYCERPHYFVVENFCSLDRKVGRAGVFCVSKQFNVSELVSEYARYTLDWS